MASPAAAHVPQRIVVLFRVHPCILWLHLDSSVALRSVLSAATLFTAAGHVNRKANIMPFLGPGKAYLCRSYSLSTNHYLIPVPFRQTQALPDATRLSVRAVAPLIVFN